MPELTQFQRDLLIVICGLADPHGAAISEELERYSDNEIHSSRLYTNLDALDDFGFIEKGRHDDRTNSYTITERGIRELEARRDWENEYLRGVISDQFE